MPSSDQAPALTARQVSERENSKHLKSILGHDHSLDPKVNGSILLIGSPLSHQENVVQGLELGQEQEMKTTRYQAEQNQVHMQSHANEELSTGRKMGTSWPRRCSRSLRFWPGTYQGSWSHQRRIGTAEHSQLSAHGANINRAQIRYEANENLPQSHRTDETASNDLWSAGSDPKYQHTATRDTGATILKDRKSITEKPGGNEYKSIEAQRKSPSP